MCLVNISECNSFTYFKCPIRRLFLPHYHPEESCFSGAIGTDNTNNSVWRQAEFKTLKKQFVIKRFCNGSGLNNFITKPGSVRDKYFKFIFLLFHILIKKVFISA